MKKVLPWKKCAWKKCKQKYPKYLFVSKISKNIFLAEEEGQQQQQQELSLPVLLLWQAANASREPHVYLFIYLLYF